MKRIYIFLMLFLMSFLVTAHAQFLWNKTSEKNLSADQISQISDNEHFFAIAAGDYTQSNGEPGIWSKNSGFYFSSGKEWMNPNLDKYCIFNIIKLEETKNGFPIYILKNNHNKKYFCSPQISNEHFTDNINEAYHFTIRDAVLMDEPQDYSAIETWSWEDYSHAASKTRNTLAEEKGAVIFCQTDKPQYLTFAQILSSWTDTNNWLVYEVDKKPMSAYEYFCDIFHTYFTSKIEELIFPGTDIGCVPQDFYDYASSIYEEALILSKNPQAPAEDCDRLREAIVDLFNQIPGKTKKLTPGYYVFKNKDYRGFLTLTQDGRKGRGNRSLVETTLHDEEAYNNWTPASMTEWNVDQANYIWKVETTENGKIFLKNLGTKQYISYKNNFSMVDEGYPFEVCIYSPNQIFFKFLEKGNTGILHVAIHSNNMLINYPHPEDPASRFSCHPIDSTVINKLLPEITQKRLLEDLTFATNAAYHEYYDNQFSNILWGNSYRHPEDSGLVTKVLEANASCYKEAEEYLFDGNMQTYYHTEQSSYSAPTKINGYHYIKVDLGKEVNHLIIKLSKRQHTRLNHICQYALYTPEDGNPERKDWNKQVAISEREIDFQYDNQTHIANYDFNEPVRYLCFTVLHTTDETMLEQEDSKSGPFWHASELRFYDADELQRNPLFEKVTPALKQNLEKAIEKAKKELATDNATETTLKELQLARQRFDKIISKSAAKYLYLNDLSAIVGETGQLQVHMKNECGISNIQFDLYLPKGISVSYYQDTPRSETHYIEKELQSDSCIRILCSSINKEAFMGFNGPVLNLNLAIDSHIKEGLYDIKIKNILLTTPCDYQYTCPDISAKLDAHNYILGDVNEDRVLDSQDVDAMANLILEDYYLFNKKTCDINNDGILNTIDITGAINLLLKPDSVSNDTVKASSDDISLEILPFSISTNEKKEVKVLLKNIKDSFTAMQFDLYLPEGIYIKQDNNGKECVNLGSRTDSTHNVLIKRNYNIYKFLIYSNRNHNYNGEQGDVLTMTLCSDKNVTEEYCKDISINGIVLGRSNVSGYIPKEGSSSTIIHSLFNKNEVHLNGHFTKEVIKEFSEALNLKHIYQVFFDNSKIDSSEIFKTGNPNTLFFVHEGMNLANPHNVVKDGLCKSFVLTDGYPFYTSNDFYAEEAFYKRNITKGGWYTIYLPFTTLKPESVTINKLMALREREEMVYFENTDSILANTPYIFKAESDTEFKTKNTTIEAIVENNINSVFKGTYSLLPTSGGRIFSLNEDGTQFNLCASNSYIPEFCAYLKSNINVPVIKIHNDWTTGITNEHFQTCPYDIYGIDGKLIKRQAESHQDLNKGIYIINGKKIIK